MVVMNQASLDSVPWDADPLVFNFHNEIPGKVKMHTRFLDQQRDWVRIDASYPAQMVERRRLWDLYPDKVFVSETTEENSSVEDCKWELFETLVEHLPERFPYIFEKREKSIYNKVLDEEVSTERYPTVNNQHSEKTASNPLDDDPLIRAARLTQEDWVILQWDDTEQTYKLTAGIVYFPMRWSLREKFKKGMAGIHVPVKPFMDHLVNHVYDVFKKMKPEKPLWRANWAVFNDLDGPMDLYTPTGSVSREKRTSVYNPAPSPENRDKLGMKQPMIQQGSTDQIIGDNNRFITGTEISFRSNNKVDHEYKDDKDSNTEAKEETDITGRELTFRAEYQTLRKLPNTKCIVFGIRTYQRYLEEFKKLPVTDSEALITAIENLNDDFTDYKGAHFWKDAAVKYLQQDCIDPRVKSKLNGDAGVENVVLGTNVGRQEGDKKKPGKGRDFWFSSSAGSVVGVVGLVAAVCAGIAVQRLLKSG